MGYEGNGQAMIGEGGNRRTQIPAARLYLDPNSSAQGRGFWTGKHSPSGKVSPHSDEADLSRLTAYQDKGVDVTASHYYEELPEEEDETIKAMTSQQLFSEAHRILQLSRGRSEAQPPARYVALKKELSHRVFMKSVHEAFKAMGSAEPMPTQNNKEAFDAMHGVDDETSTEDKDDLTGEGQPTEKSKVKKAIGTKSSDRREKPQKKAKPTVKAKVGASSNGNKTYDYPKKEKPSAGQSAAPAQPEKATVEGEGTQTEVNPERLASVLRIDVARLKKLASMKSEASFISYFKAKGGSFLRKYKVPDSYLSEVFRVLNGSGTDASQQ